MLAYKCVKLSEEKVLNLIDLVIVSSFRICKVKNFSCCLLMELCSY